MASDATNTERLKLRLSFERNPRNAPLLEGEVTVPGVELDWEGGDPGAAFLHHLVHNDFDVFEFSISHYMYTRTLPNPAYQGWTMLPVFTSKPVFLYRSFFLRAASGVSGLADLKGKRVGVPDFTMTGAVWLRIILRELHGITPQDITWINTRPAHLRQGHAMGSDHDTATGVNVVNIDESTTPQQMIERGELDAVLGTHGAAVEANSGILLFGPEQWLGVLAQLVAKIGVTPVNHGVVVQKRLLEQRPSLARDLFSAFERSKSAAYASDPTARTLLPELDATRQRELFGDDPYPFGLRRNRRILELVADQNVLDGLLRERPDFDALFAASVRDT